MKLLIIKANAIPETSHTEKLVNKFIEGYKEKNPKDEIKVRELYDTPIDFLRKEDIGKMMNGEENKAAKTADDFLAYDKIILAYPMWNFSFPAIVKAYFDYISYFGKTFKYTETGPIGLADGRIVGVISSTGGDYSSLGNNRSDLMYIKQLFEFFNVQYKGDLTFGGTRMIFDQELIEKENEYLNKAYDFGKSF